MYDFEPNFQRVLTAIQLEQPDRVPNAELFVDPSIKRAFLGKPVVTLQDDIEFWRSAGYDYVVIDADLYSLPQIQQSIAAPADNPDSLRYGCGPDREWVNSEAREVTTWEEVERFPWPTADQVSLGPLQDAVECLPQNMGVLVSFGHVFTAAWQLMGFETFCVSALEDLDLVMEIMRRLGEETLLVLDRVLRHKTVGVLCYQDDIAYTSGPMLSPALLRRLFFPWLRRAATMCRRAGRPMLFHSDGKLDSVLPDIVECGVDGIQAIEPKCMDIAAVKTEYGDRLALMGNVDLGYTLTRGSPEDVREEVKSIIRHAGRGGGLLVGSANSITDYVPLANYRALLEAVFEHGRYPIAV